MLSLPERCKMFSLQLPWVSASAKCFTSSLLMLSLPERCKLFSLQLPWVSASAKCFTPLPLMLSLPERCKRFSLQLLWVSASAKCRAPSSSISLPWRFNLRSLAWLHFLSLIASSGWICLQPNGPRLLLVNSRLLTLWLLSKFTNPKHSTGPIWQLLKSAALKPIWRSLVCKIGSSTSIS